MDTQNQLKIPECGSVPDLRQQRLVVGAKQLRKALLGGRAQYVYLARNADPAVTEPIETLCQSQNVPYAWVHSMEALGRACGIEVGAAAAAAVN